MPVILLQLSCNIATEQLEHCYNYPVTLLRGCWRKFTEPLGEVLKMSILLLVDIYQLILPRSETNLLGIVDDVSAVLAVDALLQRL